MCLKTCENGCDSSYIFKVEYEDGAIEHFCSECLSNIIREVPEIIVKMEAIWKMVEITLEVSEIVARFFNNVQGIKDVFGDEYTPGMVLEEALRDAIKAWADWTLEEDIEFMEGKD